jgi:hypothetical protein
VSWVPDRTEKQIRALAASAALTTSVWMVVAVVGIVRKPTDAGAYAVYGLMSACAVVFLARRAWSLARKPWDICLWLNGLWLLPALEARHRTSARIAIATGVISIILALLGRRLDLRSKVAVAADGGAQLR